MNKKTILDRVFQQKVTLLFVLLCLGGILASGQPVTFVAGELFTRAARNSFLVLSLIIPVVTGMGLNFGIVIGAMAAQVALFLTTCWGFGGIGGFLLTALLTTPLAALLGWLVGKLFNRIKGSEMIGGLVLGYFADGFYQLLFLFVFGGVIPMGGPNAGRLLLSTGVGVKNTIDLTGTVKYALDAVPMLAIAEAAFYLTAAGAALSAILKLWKRQPVDWKKTGAVLAGASALYALTFLPAAERQGKRLVMEGPASLWWKGDEAALRQLVSILLDNAVKYCDPGGAIRVGLLEKRRPVLTVDNSCQHVNELPLPRLFDRFYRGDSARTYGSGFGVGLSIAKGIAQRQGGDITALGLEGDKIRFRVKL